MYRNLVEKNDNRRSYKWYLAYKMVKLSLVKNLSDIESIKKNEITREMAKN